MDGFNVVSNDSNEIESGRILQEGGLIGDPFIILKGARHSFSLIAKSDVDIREISKEQLQSLFSRFPGVKLRWSNIRNSSFGKTNSSS